MKYFICAFGLLFIFQSADAAMFKCTDADGNISFSDKPCPEQKQEQIKERIYSSPPVDSSDSLPGSDADEFFTISPIEAQAGGKKVTNSSPLAKAYMGFRNAIKRCDRDTMMKFVSRKMAENIGFTSNLEFKEACKLLDMLLHTDFKDATEVINGDKGTIQWLTIETSTDSSGTSTMKSERSENFVKEDGVWKYGD
jgi:hypothetical protein